MGVGQRHISWRRTKSVKGTWCKIHFDKTLYGFEGYCWQVSRVKVYLLCLILCPKSDKTQHDDQVFVSIQAMIHEVQRIGNIVPLSIIHAAIKDTEIMGYSIPKVSGIKHGKKTLSITSVNVTNIVGYPLRVRWSSLTWAQPWKRRDTGKSLMNSTQKTSSTTRESFSNPRPSCLSLEVNPKQAAVCLPFCHINKHLAKRWLSRLKM